MTDLCEKCGLREWARFHMLASPNADALKGQIRDFPRLSLHRNHLRQGSREWEYLCVECYEALPCSPARRESQREVNFYGPLDN